MKKPDQPPPGLKDKIGAQAKVLGQRGRDELTRKGGLGDSAHGIFRRWFRKVWETRGGGFYAFGFALTFLYLEVVEFVTDDIPLLFSINILSGDIFAFIIQFVVDTIKNMIQAFIWPVWWIQLQWPAGIIALVLIYFVFSSFIQRPLENWIFEGVKPASSDRKSG